MSIRRTSSWEAFAAVEDTAISPPTRQNNQPPKVQKSVFEDTWKVVNAFNDAMENGRSLYAKGSTLVSAGWFKGFFLGLCGYKKDTYSHIVEMLIGDDVDEAQPMFGTITDGFIERLNSDRNVIMLTRIGENLIKYKSLHIPEKIGRATEWEIDSNRQMSDRERQTRLYATSLFGRIDKVADKILGKADGLQDRIKQDERKRRLDEERASTQPVAIPGSSSPASKYSWSKDFVDDSNITSLSSPVIPRSFASYPSVSSISGTVSSSSSPSYSFYSQNRSRMDAGRDSPSALSSSSSRSRMDSNSSSPSSSASSRPQSRTDTGESPPPSPSPSARSSSGSRVETRSPSPEVSQGSPQSSRPADDDMSKRRTERKIDAKQALEKARIKIPLSEPKTIDHNYKMDFTAIDYFPKEQMGRKINILGPLDGSIYNDYFLRTDGAKPSQAEQRKIEQNDLKRLQAMLDGIADD